MTYDADTCRSSFADADAGTLDETLGRLTTVATILGGTVQALRDAIARAVGSDDLPSGPGGEEREPNPERNPDTLGDRIRRGSPGGDEVFDDTDRELPSDRDFEGGDRPFQEGGGLVPDPADTGGI